MYQIILLGRSAEKVLNKNLLGSTSVRTTSECRVQRACSYTNSLSRMIGIIDNPIQPVEQNDTLTKSLSRGCHEW